MTLAMNDSLMATTPLPVSTAGITRRLTVIRTDNPVDLVSYAYDLIIMIGRMLYLVNPSDTFFKNSDEVPNYYKDAVPVYFAMILGEQLIKLLLGYKLLHINDAITNLGSGFLIMLFKVALYGLYATIYIFIYDNFRLIDMPWNSLTTWFTCFILIDFLYYWWHRADHEVSFMWTSHQVHHSSDQYNFTTAIRVSVVEHIALLFVLGVVGLIVPPPQAIVHYQLAAIYQWWLHTELIGKLGPLEYIINTPSHHRVHHGRNRRYIDKNYGGALIIWDRMFGTFEEEDDKHKVVYGITTPVNSFNFFKVQYGLHWNLLKSLIQAPNWSHRLGLIFMGPGWAPGKPRLGLLEDIPEVDPANPPPIFNIRIPLWQSLYAGLHFIALAIGMTVIIGTQHVLASYWRAPFLVIYWVWSIISFGFMFDGSQLTPYTEIVRCVLYFAVDGLVVDWPSWAPEFEQYGLLMNVAINVYLFYMRFFYSVSLIIWSCFIFRRYIFFKGSKVSMKLTSLDYEASRIPSANGKKETRRATLSASSTSSLPPIMEMEVSNTCIHQKY